MMASKAGWHSAAKFWDNFAPLLYSTSPQLHHTRPPLPSFFTQRPFSRQASQCLKSPRYVLSRSFGTGLIAWSVPSKASETASVVSSCSTQTMDRGLVTAGGLKRMERKSVGGFARVEWTRRISTAARGLRGSRRHQSSRANGRTNAGKKDENGVLIQTNGGRTNGNGNGNGKELRKAKEEERAKLAAAQASEFARQAAKDHGFMNKIPQMHRPTKDELLAAASNAWQRMRIRFKWLTIRQIRPYTFDEISAFFSWFVVGHLLWIVLGTTTFFSLTIWMVNTVFAQETLAGIVGNYLTKQTGVKVVFESAIVPRWKDGTISFKNVFVSRRPGPIRGKNVQKGSSATAAAAAIAASRSEEEDEDEEQTIPVDEISDEDQNYTQFDLTIDTVNVSISLAKWMNGKGLLMDVEIKGVRGVIDRTHVHWIPGIDPTSLRHTHQPGDFEITSFKLEDLLVTIHQPHDFRPFSVSVFSMDLPQLRKQWLFYDFLSANHISGSFDDSLFTLHPRQTHGPTIQQLNAVPDGNGNGNGYPWKKTSRIRIDGLNIDHLNRGMDGPISWINAGNVDIIADIMFPTDSDEGITKIVHDLMVRMESSIAQRREKLQRLVSGEEDTADDIRLPYASLSGLEEEESGYLEAIAPSEDGMIMESTLPDNATPVTTAAIQEEDKKFLMMDLHMSLNDARASVPLWNSGMSYTHNALVRPIVAYINNRRTTIPMNCRVLKRITEFDGSWTVYDSGFMHDLSAESYDAFVKDIADADMRKRRIRAVGLWSLQVFMNAFLAAMAGTMIA